MKALTEMVVLNIKIKMDKTIFFFSFFLLNTRLYIESLKPTMLIINDSLLELK